MLAVAVYDAPELSGAYRIDPSGNITLPLAGTVHVANLTSLEAQEQLQTVFLTHEILKRPQVTVNITEYAPFVVAVEGEIARPGHIQLLAPRSLLNVIADVGGTTQIAGSVVQLTHKANGISETSSYPYSRGSNGDSIRDIIVHDGDSILVPRAGVVYVMGAVQRPGGYVMQEYGTLNVAQALSLASGTSRDAQVGGIRIVRQNLDGSLTNIPVNYKDIASGKQAPIPLLAQDIVYVPVSKLKTLFTSSAGIVGSTASTAIVATK